MAVDGDPVTSGRGQVGRGEADEFSQWKKMETSKKETGRADNWATGAAQTKRRWTLGNWVVIISLCRPR